MKGLFAVVLLALAAFAAAEEVVTVTGDNFDSIIKDNEFVLVEFFAPWCGHCKKLAPEYEKAAETLKSTGVVLGAVDATQDKDLASKFGVRGYPTLKWFVNGEAQDYKGGRSHDTIVSWVRKASGPPTRTLADTAAVTAFADDSKVAVVAYLKDASGDNFAAFEKVAKADEENEFGVTTDADAAKAAGVEAPAIVLYKKFDEGKNTYDGDFSVADITAFVTKNSQPLVIPFTMEDVGKVFQSKIGKVAFLFTETKNAAFDEVAKEFQGKMVFTFADSSNARLNSHVGVEKADFPKLVILETGSQLKKYPLDTDSELNAETLTAHIQNYLDGNAKPHYKSEAIPEDNTAPVTVIVGKNFQDIVMDPTKDVLLEVYAPWCGHCKKLTPIYEELGEKYKDNANIVIAKMDGTANEIEGLSVSGFPTIKFYPAVENKKAQDYSGARELDGFVDYLTNNAKSKPSEAKDEL